MQILVLNGVNLDMLAHRDPRLYGGLSLNELETRIYEWAHELTLTVRCRQSNSEGEYIGFWSIVKKLAAALSAGLAFPILDLSGYVPGIEQQSTAAVWALRLLYVGTPSVCNLIAIDQAETKIASFGMTKI